MTTVTAPRTQAPVTPDDLLRLSDERLYELVDGRLVKKHVLPGFRCRLPVITEPQTVSGQV